MEWLKWHTNASRIVNKSLNSIGLVCKDNKSRIMVSLDKKVGDVLILIAKAITI